MKMICYLLSMMIKSAEDKKKKEHCRKTDAAFVSVVSSVLNIKVIDKNMVIRCDNHEMTEYLKNS